MVLLKIVKPTNGSTADVEFKSSSSQSEEQIRKATSTPKSQPAKPLPVLSSPPSPVAPTISSQTGEIPIFTDQFLEHNRKIDSELRMLRKSNIDYEQQNSVLEKHVENMKNGITKLTGESNEVAEHNKMLQAYLEALRLKLSTALSGLVIPTEPNGANIHNIDKYMDDLHRMATSNSHGPASLNKARDIIRKLDLNIQL